MKKKQIRNAYNPVTVSRPMPAPTSTAPPLNAIPGGMDDEPMTSERAQREAIADYLTTQQQLRTANLDITAD